MFGPYATLESALHFLKSHNILGGTPGSFFGLKNTGDAFGALDGTSRPAFHGPIQHLLLSDTYGEVQGNSHGMEFLSPRS